MLFVVYHCCVGLLDKKNRYIFIVLCFMYHLLGEINTQVHHVVFFFLLVVTDKHGYYGVLQTYIPSVLTNVTFTAMVAVSTCSSVFTLSVHIPVSSPPHFFPLSRKPHVPHNLSTPVTAHVYILYV